ncbi:MAG TPA: hypothetical protein VK660_06860, partial [Xanthomonadaceae bacterium]|nr:hypothetical protein [Xanthomonadaceae bacterium]
TNAALATPQSSTPPATTPATGTARVAVSFLHSDKDAALIVASGRIVTGMTGNPAYPSPDPVIATIVTARDSYIVAVNAAKGNSIGIKVRRQQRKALVALLSTLAHYVQVASGGDLPTLLSSGYGAMRTRTPVGVLPAPVNLRLARGKLSGQIVARCAKVARAGAYEWRYSAATAPTAWMDLGATISAHNTIASLVPGAGYIVQARAIGTAGPSNWSASATLMVL